MGELVWIRLGANLAAGFSWPSQREFLADLAKESPQAAHVIFVRLARATHFQVFAKGGNDGGDGQLACGFPVAVGRLQLQILEPGLDRPFRETALRPSVLAEVASMIRPVSASSPVQHGHGDYPRQPFRPI